VASPFIFFLLHSTAIRPQEANESIDEEDPRPISSTWSYITKGIDKICFSKDIN